MATKKVVGGYAYRNEVMRALNATRLVRTLTNQIVMENPGQQRTLILLLKIVNANAEAADALEQIKEIVKT